MPYTTIDNLPIFYEVEGANNSNPPIIFINGWCQSARYWDTTATGLGAKWPIVLFDSRGFGRSVPRGRRFPPSFHTSIDESTDEAVKLLEKLNKSGRTKFHVVGHSLGGVTAAHFATQLEQNGKLESLTIVNSGSFEPDAKQGNTLNNFVRVFVQIKRFFNLPGVRNLVLARSAAQPLPQRYIQIIAEDFEVADARLALELSFSSLSDSNLIRYRQELTELKAPLLLIVGDKDATIPPTGMYNIKRFKPQSKFVAFPECGHLPMLERPERFIQVLAAFLQEV